MKKPMVIHPYLFALFPVISLYAHNIDQASFSSFLWAATGSLFLAWVLFKFSGYIFSSVTKGGIAATFFLIVFFSYGHSHSVILNWLARNKSRQHVGFQLAEEISKYHTLTHVFLLIVFLLLGEILVFRVLKKKSISIESTRILNWVSIVLVAFSVVSIASYGLNTQSFSDSIGTLSNPKSGGLADAAPDIYYIILDGYGRTDILEEFYGFDNSDFVDYLKKKGFYVVTDSHSNYAWTFLSLPSSLSFEYINYLADRLGQLSTDLRLPYKMIKNNRAVNFLKSRGYLFVHFCSTWGATMRNKYADKEIRYERGLFQDEFLRILIRSTMLRLLDPLIAKNLAEVHLNAFRLLETIPQMRESTFTFLHCIPPHHPYIFDRYGNIKTDKTVWNQFRGDIDMWKDGDAYIEQLIFVNSKVKSVVDRILQESEIPPIIIIQSDHGPQIYGASRADFIRARLSNFSAYYLPNGGNELLYDSMTPVNAFRVIFNYYFGTDYELLDDQCYFSTYQQPYLFEDVTKMVRNY